MPLTSPCDCEKSAHESTETVRKEHKNQQRQRLKTLKNNVLARVAGHRALAKVHDEIIYIFMFFEHLFLKKSHIFEWPVSQTLR